MDARLDTEIDDLWGAATDPDRLARWYGEVDGERARGGEFRVRITLAGRAEDRDRASSRADAAAARTPPPSPRARPRVEHLADYIRGRRLPVHDARWDELFAAYEALGVS
jgi:hypothetical protein